MTRGWSSLFLGFFGPSGILKNFKEYLFCCESFLDPWHEHRWVKSIEIPITTGSVGAGVPDQGVPECCSYKGCKVELACWARYNLFNQMQIVIFIAFCRSLRMKSLWNWHWSVKKSPNSHNFAAQAAQALEIQIWASNIHFMKGKFLLVTSLNTFIWYLIVNLVHESQLLVE